MYKITSLKVIVKLLTRQCKEIKVKPWDGARHRPSHRRRRGRGRWIRGRLDYRKSMRLSTERNRYREGRRRRRKGASRRRCGGCWGAARRFRGGERGEHRWLGRGPWARVRNLGREWWGARGGKRETWSLKWESGGGGGS